MKQNKFVVEVPLFPGFYNSPLIDDDILSYEIQDEESMNSWRENYGDDITGDDLDFDYHSMEKEICERYVDAVKTVVDETFPDLLKNISMESMSSPREYNFSTDKLFANMEFDENWRATFLNFMNDNHETLNIRIKDDWSDHSGFWSFLSNDYRDWVSEINKNEPDERYIAVMLEYMLSETIEFVNDKLIYITLDGFCYNEYIICTKEK